MGRLSHMTIFKTSKRMAKTSMSLASVLILSACTTVPAQHHLVSSKAKLTKVTQTQRALEALPPPQSKVTVAVYGFDDKTGQFKPTEAGQTLSRAVSQGGSDILVKALQDAGDRSWFTVIERSSLNNLLKERQIITEMRARYLDETSINSQALPPLLFAGVIFEGGIVGYDTNTLTGGAAARYLGIGGKTDYRQNIVTVSLRAVSVKTGEVLATVTTEKTVSSVGVAGNVFKFVTFDNLLEADIGFTSNEPGLLALRQAIEMSVYALILEGANTGLWSFEDKLASQTLLKEYFAELDGEYFEEEQSSPPPVRMANAAPAKLDQSKASVTTVTATPLKGDSADTSQASKPTSDQPITQSDELGELLASVVEQNKPTEGHMNNARP